MNQLVDFFIVGAQKAGTTALDQFLRRQAGVQMPRIKEVHHFDDEVRVDWSAPDHQRLHGFFDWSKMNVIRGEATPIYIFWPHALERIRSYNQQAKLIIGLRHPAFRAYSQWRMQFIQGKETLSFSDVISPSGRGRMQDGSWLSLRLYSYVERGFYARQISRALDLFPRKQIHFYRTDALWKDANNTLGEIAAFLTIELDQNIQTQYITPYKPKDIEALDAIQRDYLTGLYREDMLETEKLTGMDLSDWIHPDYEEPMTADLRH